MSDLAARQAVLDALFDRLAAIPNVEEFDVNPSGEPSHFPAVYLNEEDQDADDSTEPGATRYDLTLTIEGYVEGSGGIEATRARSALYLAIVEAVQGEFLHPAIEEVHEGRMRLATTVLAMARRLGFSLVIKIRFVAPTNSPVE